MLRDIFQERIAPKSIETDMAKLYMKFSALNVDFDCPILNFLSSKKPAHKGIKKRYPRKSHYFTVVGQSFVKWLQITMGMLLITTSTSDELFSHINVDDSERP